MRVFDGVEEFRQVAGTHLGYSDWHTITQEQIDLFADATDDHQWIHVDPVRAAAGPFGGTVAHGFLTLSLVPKLAWQVYRVENLSMSVNYGSNKVRFPAPVLAGQRIRVGVELLSVEQRSAGWEAIARATVEREGADKPACVAEIVSLLVP